MKTILLIGIWGVVTSVSVIASPLDITFTGSRPTHLWGTDFTFPLEGLDFQFEDVVSDISESPGTTINLAGVNSINVTWSAPAGYMYVVQPPPAAIGDMDLQFEATYGFGNAAASLGSIISQSISVHTISGTSPLGELVNLNTVNGPDFPALDFDAGAFIAPGTSPFAFTSLTISADFSGTGADTTLDQTESISDISSFFGVLFGVNHIFGTPYTGAPDPGPLLTLQPVPVTQSGGGGSVPDSSSTLSLAGLSFIGLWLVGRKVPPVDS